MTPSRSPLRVLFFDVFGTCVAQRPTVAKELMKAAQEALQSNSSAMSDSVRAKAEEMTYEQWDKFGAEWNRENEKFVRASIASSGTVDWRAVDNNRIELLPQLLQRYGLAVPDRHTAASGSDLEVGEGSLWTKPQLEHLGRVWHRLTPWPDTCRGLELLNTKFSTVALSNCYNDLLQELVSHSNIPFTNVYSSDMFNSYKPNPKVYVGAAEKMGVKPEECALVAAHLGDLKGAKACGFYAISVVRPLEEKAQELKKENIPDLVIEEGEDGLVKLAERLGVQID